MNKRMITLSLVLFAILTLAISCASGSKEFNGCQEKCEYNRRYCIESCGGYNRTGFTFDMKDKGSAKPYACQERCDETAERCKKNCEPLK